MVQDVNTACWFIKEASRPGGSSYRCFKFQLNGLDSHRCWPQSDWLPGYLWLPGSFRVRYLKASVDLRFFCGWSSSWGEPLFERFVGTVQLNTYIETPNDIDSNSHPLSASSQQASHSFNLFVQYLRCFFGHNLKWFRSISHVFSLKSCPSLGHLTVFGAFWG